MNWEEKYNALAELVDGYRHERNEALERLRLLEAEVERVNAREDATRRELAETRIDMRDAQRERDEARAELSKLREDYDGVLEANVGLLDGAPYVDARAAFRRGAEAMREACAREVVDGRLGVSSDDMAWLNDIASDLRDLPIPEEP